MSMGDLLAACPEILLGKFVVITLTDSGCTALQEVKGAIGGCCDGHLIMPEAYVFDGPVVLPPVRWKRVRTGPKLPFASTLPKRTELMLEQMEWMRPRAYLATADLALFATVKAARRGR
jgi:hypothetical protein